MRTVSVVLAALFLALVAGSLLLRSNSPNQGGRTVASYFDSPPAWPGPAWKHGNRTASWPEIDASAGSPHCGLQTLTFLTLGWPPGNAEPTAQGRQYVRDPEGHLVGGHLLGTWAHNPALPRDASDSGYHYGPISLYLASDWDRYVYVVAPSDSERWPRSDPPILCL